MANPTSPGSLHAKFFAIPIGIFFTLAVFGVDNKIGAVLALSGCLLLMLTKAGMEFSADKHSFREFYSLLGWRFGQWEALPAIVGVTVKYFSEFEPVSNGVNSWGIWNNTPRRYEKLVVMLSIKGKPVGMIIGNFSLDDINLAIEFAHEIAEGFDVPVHTFLPADQFKPL